MDARTSQVVAKAEADEVQFVSLQLTDIFGTVKNVTIPVDQLPVAFARGVNFDGSSVEGLARVCESDMVLRPDASTYHVLPWTEAPQRTARLICDVHDTEGRPFGGDPRQILRRVLAQAKDMGYTYHTGPEVEFFLFRMDGKPQVTPVPQDTGGYFDFSPLDSASSVRNQIALACKAMGIEVEAAHHEFPPDSTRLTSAMPRRSPAQMQWSPCAM